MSGKRTRLRRSRRRSRAALAPEITFGFSRFGVWSMVAAASVSWYVWPTTTVSIAPFASGAMSAGIRFTSAEPNRFADLRAASRAPRFDALK